MMDRIRAVLAALATQMLWLARRHALKGSVGNFGPTPVFEASRGIEKTARQGKLDGAWELYATLEDDVARLLPALHAIERSAGAAGRHRRLNHTSRRKR